MQAVHNAILSKVTSTTWLLQNALTRKLCSECALLILKKIKILGSALQFLLLEDAKNVIIAE